MKKPVAAAGAAAPKRAPAIRRLVSTKRAAPAPPPPKYPNLAEAESILWSTLEEGNRANETGKKTARGVRNAIATLLNSPDAWELLEWLIRKEARTTYDSLRADARISTCNAVAESLINPMVTNEFVKLISDVYDAAVQMDTTVAEEALQVATDLASGGFVTEGLDKAQGIVEGVDLDPLVVSKAFAMLKKSINMGGSFHMGDKMTNSLVSLTSKFNGPKKQ